MNNLVKLSTIPSFEYDWHQIKDHSDRHVAETAVKNYQKMFTELRGKAERNQGLTMNSNLKQVFSLALAANGIVAKLCFNLRAS